MFSLRLLIEHLRSALWFRSTLWVVALALLATVLINLDQRVNQAELYRLMPWLLVDGVDGARTMLGAVSSAMLTVTTLAFSIMMVAIVQTANAYSPRILQQYLGDTSHQHILGILLGTFLYCLIVLRVVRSSNEGEFVPSLSVAVAFLLTMLCIGAFIYFIHHVSHSIEVSAIIARLRNDSLEMIPTLYPSGIGKGWRGEGEPPLPSGPPGLIRAQRSGYVEAVNAEQLMKAVTTGDVIVELLPSMGDFVLPHAPIAHIWPAEALLNEPLVESIERSVERGDERTLVEDMHYGIRQIADMALRALSPAINDPTTATNCLDAMATLLVAGCKRTHISPYRCDREGTLRVIAHGPTFESLLELAYIQLRHYSNGDVIVLKRMIDLLGELGLIVDEAHEHVALHRQLGMVARAAQRTVTEPLDRAQINERLRHAAECIDVGAPIPLISPTLDA